jgi:ribonuclease E
MQSKMLVDAAHPEETRVVVVKGNRVEEFDYESANKKQLRGNIYLAKVTRVEPSLQAAFVDYGGNRHGFLAFAEIHPDYYQIPVADRQALLDEEAAEQSRASAEEAAEDDAAAGRRRRGRRGRGRHEGLPRQDMPRPEGAGASAAATERNDRPDSLEEDGETVSHEGGAVVALEHSDLIHEVSESVERAEEAEIETIERTETRGATEDDEDDEDDAEPAETVGQPVAMKEGNGEASAETVESVGSEDALEEVPERARRRRGRPYKIQEVIRRRQIILVQVVKEERGNKGAALTTYLSLAGRYTVLMPNTARGGGISRKITQPTDRKRLREIAGELEVPEGMGLIIRTAGAQRTKTEIKRDYDYLLRLWENVRDLTLKSTAPALVYEEGSLIKRSIRDLYNKDIEEVLVAGDEAYREAKDFMRMLMPSHAKNVKPYKEPEPVFIRYQVERQLAAMFSPQVVLKSGGYIVINQTEALVAVDVNSGKATREHNIEDTALKTNLEASEEIARQLRLRDLAGLIVIDFIDMDERRNSRLVERRLKESLHNDRARIQVGRISHFGLMEMSRQRLRPGMLEGSTKPCPMCQGTGIVRSIESVSLDILRSIEDRLITDGVVPLVATTAVEVALYILNQKRAHLNDIQLRYRIPITVTADEEMHVSQFVIERAAEGEMANGGSAVVHMDWAHHHEAPAASDSDSDSDSDSASAPSPSVAPAAAEAAEGEGDQTRRRSRRRRRKRHPEGGAEVHRSIPREAPEQEDEEPIAESMAEEAGSPEAGSGPGAEVRKGPRRRGRRGGRRGRSGQRPPGAPGETEAPRDMRADTGPRETSRQEPHAGEAGSPSPREDRQNGAARESKPQREEEFGRAVTEHPRRDTEPMFAGVTSAREEPAPARVESQVEQEAVPPRKGWWRR